MTRPGSERRIVSLSLFFPPAPAPLALFSIEAFFKANSRSSTRFIKELRGDEYIHNRLRRLSLLCRTLSENWGLARRARTLEIYLDGLEGVTVELPPVLDVGCLRMMVEADLGLTMGQQEGVWEWLRRQRVSGRGAGDFYEGKEGDEGTEEEEEWDAGFLGPEVYLGILIMACPELQLQKVEGTTHD